MRNLFKSLIHSLRSDQSGAASVELVLVFPIFFMVFVSAFEVAMMNARAVMLERATDIVVRDLRLNASGTDPDYDTILTNVCNLTMMIPDCAQTVKIQMNPVDQDNWTTMPSEVDCIKRDEDIEPVIQFVNGQENELMLVRVCAVLDPFFPTVGIGRSMPKDSSGGYIVIASSAFVNEPN